MIHVREFEDRDAARVAEILFVGFLPVFGDYMTQKEPDPPESVIAGAHMPGHQAWVAEVDGAVVGYLLVSADCRHGLGTLQVIAVDPACAIRGVGSALMAPAEEFWKERKMRKIATCVASINPKAQAFYRRHGFVAEGTLKDHFFAGVDEICLAKFLDSALDKGGDIGYAE